VNNNPAPCMMIIASNIIAHWLLCLPTVLHVCMRMYAHRLVKRVIVLPACYVH
jgi:hypothetical protein